VMTSVLNVMIGSITTVWSSSDESERIWALDFWILFYFSVFWQNNISTHIYIGEFYFSNFLFSNYIVRPS